MDREPVTIPAEATLLDAQEQFFLRYRWPWFAVVDPARHFLGVVREQRVDEEIAAGRPALRGGRRARGRTCRCRSAKRRRWNRCSASEGLGRLGAMVAVDSDGVLQGVVTLAQVRQALRPARDRRACRGARRAIQRPAGAGSRVQGAARYRVPARIPSPNSTSRSHASTRRLDHRRRSRRPARRAGRRPAGRQRGDHEQGPPGALALGGRRRRHQRRDQRRRRLALARLRHRQGLGLPRRPGRDRNHVLGGPQRGHAPRAHRRHLPPQRQGRNGPARVRRRVDEAHRLRRRHHRPGAAARALRAADEAPRDGRALRGVVHDLAAARRGRRLLRA